MKQNRPSSIPNIQRAAVDQQPLRFSFKHLDLGSPKFNPDKCCQEYFCKLFAILQRFSTWKVEQFIDQNNTERRHSINFAETSEPDGFQNVPGLDRDQAAYAEGWQFAVDYSDWGCEWRAHGILIDDIFYIVWLDPDHLLYRRKLLPPAPDPPR